LNNEDKTAMNKKTLLPNDLIQHHESIEDLCQNIRVGKAAQITDDFQIIASVESLIHDNAMPDAHARAAAYSESAADAEMIHSRKK
ncbi:isocitrate lyase/phosphoenolpyruvate mutase family protein, partial [Burkholderia pseudomallei]